MLPKQAVMRDDTVFNHPVRGRQRGDGERPRYETNGTWSGPHASAPRGPLLRPRRKRAAPQEPRDPERRLRPDCNVRPRCVPAVGSASCVSCAIANSIIQYQRGGEVGDATQTQEPLFLSERPTHSTVSQRHTSRTLRKANGPSVFETKKWNRPSQSPAQSIVHIPLPF
jgi:hypothetical protein